MPRDVDDPEHGGGHLGATFPQRPSPARRAGPQHPAGGLAHPPGDQPHLVELVSLSPDDLQRPRQLVA